MTKSVCDFDTFRGSPPRQLPNGWTEFILSGDPSFSPSDDTYWGAPSLMVRSDGGTFHIGIYTQVNVEPGKGYRASIAWGAPNAPSTFGRRLGIDPFGGTDPTSTNVVWGPEHYGDGRILNYPPPDVNIDVRARAAGSTMTVFFKVNHPRSTGDNLIFIDAIALYPDESAPASAPPPPTPTWTPQPYVPPTLVPPPPTFTYAPPLPYVSPTFTYAPPPPTFTYAPPPQPYVPPTPVPPAPVPPAPVPPPTSVQPASIPPTRLPLANTPRPFTKATDLPTRSAKPLPTFTPTATPSPTATPTITPSPTPTWTPLPTVPPAEAGVGLLQTQARLIGSMRNVQSRQMAGISMLGFWGAGISGFLLWLVRRRRRGSD